jgi:hypothetical protein
VSSAPPLSLADLTAYVAALPENAAKATLRGLVVAARVLHGDTVDERLLTRMRSVVSAYVNSDPMRKLEHALSRCQRVHAARESKSE